MLRPVDDRNVPCGMAGLTPRQLLLRALGIRRLADQHSQGEMDATVGREVGWALAGGVVGVILWQLLHKQWPVFGWTGYFLGMVIFSPIVAIVVWWFTLERVRRTTFGTLSNLYLSNNQCAACGYDLAGLAPDAQDQCIVCPECGAAWRADRLGRNPQDNTTDTADA